MVVNKETRKDAHSKLWCVLVPFTIHIILRRGRGVCFYAKKNINLFISLWTENIFLIDCYICDDSFYLKRKKMRMLMRYTAAVVSWSFLHVITHFNRFIGTRKVMNTLNRFSYKQQFNTRTSYHISTITKGKILFL
jgi:hypothetical protein